MLVIENKKASILLILKVLEEMQELIKKTVNFILILNATKVRCFIGICNTVNA